jgi:hypothetical protein
MPRSSSRSPPRYRRRSSRSSDRNNADFRVGSERDREKFRHRDQNKEYDRENDTYRNRDNENGRKSEKYTVRVGKDKTEEGEIENDDEEADRSEMKSRIDDGRSRGGKVYKADKYNERDRDRIDKIDRDRYKDIRERDRDGDRDGVRDKRVSERDKSRERERLRDRFGDRGRSRERERERDRRDDRRERGNDKNDYRDREIKRTHDSLKKSLEETLEYDLNGKRLKSSADNTEDMVTLAVAKAKESIVYNEKELKELESFLEDNEEDEDEEQKAARIIEERKRRRQEILEKHSVNSNPNTNTHSNANGIKDSTAGDDESMESFENNDATNADDGDEMMNAEFDIVKHERSKSDGNSDDRAFQINHDDENSNIESNTNTNASTGLRVEDENEMLFAEKQALEIQQQQERNMTFDMFSYTPTELRKNEAVYQGKAVCRCNRR